MSQLFRWPAGLQPLHGSPAGSAEWASAGQAAAAAVSSTDGHRPSLAPAVLDLPPGLPTSSLAQALTPLVPCWPASTSSSQLLLPSWPSDMVLPRHHSRAPAVSALPARSQVSPSASAAAALHPCWPAGILSAPATLHAHVHAAGFSVHATGFTKFRRSPRPEGLAVPSGQLSLLSLWASAAPGSPPGLQDPASASVLPAGKERPGILLAGLPTLEVRTLAPGAPAGALPRAPAVPGPGTKRAAPSGQLAPGSAARRRRLSPHALGSGHLGLLPAGFDVDPGSPAGALPEAPAVPVPGTKRAAPPGQPEPGSAARRRRLSSHALSSGHLHLHLLLAAVSSAFCLACGRAFSGVDHASLAAAVPCHGWAPFLSASASAFLRSPEALALLAGLPAGHCLLAATWRRGVALDLRPREPG